MKHFGTQQHSRAEIHTHTVVCVTHQRVSNFVGVDSVDIIIDCLFSGITAKADYEENTTALKTDAVQDAEPTLRLKNVCCISINLMQATTFNRNKMTLAVQQRWLMMGYDRVRYT